MLATVAVASALGVISFRNPIYSMLSLILNLVSLAFFFLMLEAIFIATIQILIYAGRGDGALPLRRDDAHARGRRHRRARPAALAVGRGRGPGDHFGGWADYRAAQRLAGADAKSAGLNGLSEAVARFGNTEAFGQALFHGFTFPFEVTGVLLVIAVLGAVVLGRRFVRDVERERRCRFPHI